MQTRPRSTQPSLMQCSPRRSATFVTAEQQYSQLALTRPDDPAARGELAEFLRRRDRNQRAVETYHEVLRLGRRRRTGLTSSCASCTRDWALSAGGIGSQRAIALYRPGGHRGGEAQALLCLGEAQRDEGRARVPEARRNAAAAPRSFSRASSSQ